MKHYGKMYVTSAIRNLENIKNSEMIRPYWAN